MRCSPVVHPENEMGKAGSEKAVDGFQAAISTSQRYDDKQIGILLADSIRL